MVLMSTMVILLFSAIMVISGCGGGDSGGGGGDYSPIPSSSPTSSPTMNPQAMFVMGSTDLMYTGNNVLDNQDYSKGEKKAVNLPDEPVTPPVIPSQSSGVSNTYTYTYGDVTVNIVAYLYSDKTLEWIETETFMGTVLSKGYFKSSVTAESLTSITRTMTFSRWSQSDTKLLAYGEATVMQDYIAGTLEANGSQAVKTENETIGYSFDLTINTNGELIGTLEFTNGTTANINRPAINPNASTSQDIYSKTTVAFDGVLLDLTVVTTVYGDNSVKVEKTGVLYDSVYIFNADGSGSGTITSNTTGKVNSAEWNGSGEGTLTLSTGTQVPFYIPIPAVYRLPSM